MLEWKTIVINHKNYIGMKMILPRQKLYIISSTKCILVGKAFQLDQMSKDIAIFIMEKSDSYEALLRSKVIAMNAKAKYLGYEEGMSGKEVLSYTTHQK